MEDDYTYLILPLYEDPDYYYTVPLENVAYKIRFYYNTRAERWVMDVRYADNEPIILNSAVLPNYPMLADYPLPFSGFFLLNPKTEEINQVTSNPYEIWKYYELLYCYKEVDLNG